MKNITSFNFTDLKQFKKVFCLVSGGIDSTYLLEMCEKYHDNVFPVNAFNPYEQSKALKLIMKNPKFIQVKPDERYIYGDILKEAFLKIPEAMAAKRVGKYHKKIFPCCYYIKHKAFLKDSVFQEKGTVVISGIKYGDGQQRRFWLRKLWKEKRFYHEHKSGQLYCYPFRDFKQRELPDDIIEQLREKYEDLDHSGCALCPVLVVFDIKSEGKRYVDSMRYAHKLLGRREIGDLK